VRAGFKPAASGIAP